MSYARVYVEKDTQGNNVFITGLARIIKPDGFVIAAVIPAAVERPVNRRILFQFNHQKL